MRTRLIVSAALALLATAAVAPALAVAPKGCVVVNAPGGAHLQLGYAPTGPDSCIPLP